MDEPAVSRPAAASLASSRSRWFIEMVAVDFYVASLRNDAAALRVITTTLSWLTKQPHCKVHLVKVTGPSPPPSINQTLCRQRCNSDLATDAKETKCQDNKNTCMHSGVSLSIRCVVGLFFQRSDTLRRCSITQVSFKTAVYGRQLGISVGLNVHNRDGTQAPLLRSTL